MQLRIQIVESDSTEEIAVKSDHRGIKIFLSVLSAAWLIASQWMTPHAILRRTEGMAPGQATVAVWWLGAITLVGCLAWVIFGRRIATFRGNELRIQAAIGPLPLRRSRVYCLPDVCGLRLALRGINGARGFRITERSIVFDYRGGTIALFTRLPEHAAESVLHAVQLHALEGAVVAGSGVDRALGLAPVEAGVR